MTHRRVRIAYAGSSNWRGDQQLSDDLLLRIADRGVYDAYGDYWELIRGRAASDQLPTATDMVAPSSALTARRRSVRIAASDGHNVAQLSGIKRLHVEMSGARTGTWEFLGEHDGYAVEDLPVKGGTTVTYWAEDNAGNVEPPHTVTVPGCSTRPH